MSDQITHSVTAFIGKGIDRQYYTSIKCRTSEEAFQSVVQIAIADDWHPKRWYEFWRTKNNHWQIQEYKNQKNA